MRRCFACDRPLPLNVCEAWTSDPQVQHVGPDCFAKIKASGADGYQPPLGGPRLYLREEWACAASETPRRITCRVCGRSDTPGSFCEAMAADMRSGSLCFSCLFWRDRVTRASEPGHVVAGGIAYFIGPPTNEPAQCRGFGGRAFTVHFLDGRTVETSNLWCQGNVPDVWRSALPDNATLS